MKKATAPQGTSRFTDHRSMLESKLFLFVQKLFNFQKSHCSHSRITTHLPFTLSSYPPCCSLTFCPLQGGVITFQNLTITSDLTSILKLVQFQIPSFLRDILFAKWNLIPKWRSDDHDMRLYSLSITTTSLMVMHVIMTQIFSIGAL